ncbi:hypothetical protein AGMMS49992_18220 [Clostridia bacterium]|nr:hypothetical protein AGMMS49992_18220 [Clostridia bacterium]
MAKDDLLSFVTKSGANIYVQLTEEKYSTYDEDEILAGGVVDKIVKRHVKNTNKNLADVLADAVVPITDEINIVREKMQLKPDELEVTFGVGFEGALPCIVKGSAVFEIRMMWSWKNKDEKGKG